MGVIIRPAGLPGVTQWLSSGGGLCPYSGGTAEESHLFPYYPAGERAGTPLYPRRSTAGRSWLYYSIAARTVQGRAGGFAIFLRRAGPPDRPAFCGHASVPGGRAPSPNYTILKEVTGDLSFQWFPQSEAMLFEQDGKYSLKKLDGTIVLPAVYGKIGKEFGNGSDDGYMTVFQQGRVGVADRYGRIILQPER